jgi:hypothetical protein
MTERAWRVTLSALGAIYLAQAAWAAADPASFTERLADFGAYNPHLVRDFAAAAATFGLGLPVAARVRAWRTPALALAAVWNGLHAVSHLADVDHAHPHAVGPLEAVALVAVTALLVALTWLSTKEIR